MAFLASTLCSTLELVDALVRFCFAWSLCFALLSLYSLPALQEARAARAKASLQSTIDNASYRSGDDETAEVEDEDEKKKLTATILASVKSLWTTLDDLLNLSRSVLASVRSVGLSLALSSGDSEAPRAPLRVLRCKAREEEHLIPVSSGLSSSAILRSASPATSWCTCSGNTSNVDTQSSSSCPASPFTICSESQQSASTKSSPTTNFKKLSLAYLFNRESSRLGTLECHFCRDKTPGEDVLHTMARSRVSQRHSEPFVSQFTQKHTKQPRTNVSLAVRRDEANTRTSEHDVIPQVGQEEEGRRRNEAILGVARVLFPWNGGCRYARAFSAETDTGSDGRAQSERADDLVSLQEAEMNRFFNCTDMQRDCIQLIGTGSRPLSSTHSVLLPRPLSPSSSAKTKRKLENWSCSLMAELEKVKAIQKESRRAGKRRTLVFISEYRILGESRKKWVEYRMEAFHPRELLEADPEDGSGSSQGLSPTIREPDTLTMRSLCAVSGYRRITAWRRFGDFTGLRRAVLKEFRGSRPKVAAKNVHSSVFGNEGCIIRKDTCVDRRGPSSSSNQEDNFDVALANKIRAESPNPLSRLRRRTQIPTSGQHPHTRSTYVLPWSTTRTTYNKTAANSVSHDLNKGVMLDNVAHERRDFEIPALPPRGMFRRFDRDHIMQRMQALQIFLRELVRIEEIRELSCVRSFVELS